MGSEMCIRDSTHTHISDIVAYLPSFHLAEARSYCTTVNKGAIMRRLNEQHETRNGEQVDGIKIELANHEWVHITPDPDFPYFTIIAEGHDAQRASDLVEEYRIYIEQILPAPEATN